MLNVIKLLGLVAIQVDELLGFQSNSVLSKSKSVEQFKCLLSWSIYECLISLKQSFFNNLKKIGNRTWFSREQEFGTYIPSDVQRGTPRHITEGRAVSYGVWDFVT